MIFVLLKIEVFCSLCSCCKINYQHKELKNVKDKSLFLNSDSEKKNKNAKNVPWGEAEHEAVITISALSLNYDHPLVTSFSFGLESIIGWKKEHIYMYGFGLNEDVSGGFLCVCCSLVKRRDGPVISQHWKHTASRFVTGGWHWQHAAPPSTWFVKPGRCI